MNAILFILTFTYFVLDNVIYRQTYGTPMGLSPVIADLVLQDIENKALYKINMRLSLYYRYVDDILLVAPEDDINRIVNIFNSFHERLKFTPEVERNRFISSLVN